MNEPTTVTVVVQFIDPDDAASDPQAKVQSRCCEVPASKLWTFLNRYEVPDPPCHPTKMAGGTPKTTTK